MRALAGILCVVALVSAGPRAQAPQGPGAAPLKWYKGNTHTHTLNSDGDSTPEDVVRWYREQRYHFLFITDHNVVTAVDGLNAVHAMPERFLLVRGEEVTDQAAGKPVHLNLLGGAGVVAPQGGATVAEALRRNVAAMSATGGVISINHPNFGWAMTAADLSAGRGAHLLEIFNGHPMVNNDGGGGLPGAEALWDSLLGAGVRVFGAASDDMHHLKQPWSASAARPGQGWVVVRAPALTADAVLAALASGDFYASTGVELSDIRATPERLTVTIKTQEYAKYAVHFIGQGGRVLKEATTSPATYDIAGHEGYVRARVLDSNGRRAWTQPVFVAPRARSQVASANAVGVFLRCTGQDDPLRALQAAKSLGVDTIQVSKLPDRFYTPQGAAEFAGMLRATGIRADSVVAVFAGESYADRDAVVRTVGFRPLHLIEERLVYLRKCVDFAQAIGAGLVTFHMGFLPDNPEDGAYTSMLTAVTDIAAYAATRQVTISLETGQETGQQLAAFLDRISVARVGVNFDPANLIIYGVDSPSKALKHVLSRVTSVHVKDALLPDKPGAMGREVRPGEGRAELSECFRMLRASGFTGALIIENYVARGLKTDPMDELRIAQAFLKRSGW
jgi:sugar phosphate isomerase/epimerase